MALEASVPVSPTAGTPKPHKGRGRPRIGRTPRVVMSAMSVAPATKATMDKWTKDFSWKIADCPPGIIQDLLVQFGRDRGFDWELTKPMKGKKS